MDTEQLRDGIRARACIGGSITAWAVMKIAPIKIHPWSGALNR